MNIYIVHQIFLDVDIEYLQLKKAHKMALIVSYTHQT